MTVTEVRPSAAIQPIPSRFDIAVILAFFVIYVVWGSTFIVIRIAVQHIPPLLAAALRFTPAGILLFAWSRLRGAPNPTRLEWRNLALLGALMFFITYSALFWGEQRVPSGIASVLASTLPLSTMVLEVFVFKKERMRWPLVIAIGIGFSGVAVLTLGRGSGSVPLFPAIVILLGEIGWAVGAVLSRSLSVPESKFSTAGAEMMLGGAMLGIGSLFTGEMRPFPAIPLAAGLAIVYLIVVGSLIGFTSFVWLLSRFSATHVSSHAYVNPVVALALAYWIGRETIGANVLIGTALVLASVVGIFVTRGRGAQPK